MVAVLWEMIFRGTDTVAILLEWILARMVLHPDIQAKAQSEIDSVVGKTRLVPAGTTAMVNMWAITHDERVWSEPNEFKPERFVEEDVAIMGSDLRLAPFGSGRRVCPGKAMGLATVHLWLAQLLQSFEWVAADGGGGGGGVDLSEVLNLNLSMEMKNPLVCKAVARAF